MSGLISSCLQFDLETERLWRDGREIPLTPKTFALLRYFVAHPNRLLSKQALLDAVWSERYVNEGEVRHYIRELRRALNDCPRTSRYIETVHGRGYRWIGAIAIADGPAPLSQADQPAASSLTPSSAAPPLATDALLGRQAELTQLRRWLEDAKAGRRQVALISGETGIGKTALVAKFVKECAEQRQWWVGRGQCIKQHGQVEPYLPLLAALEELCRGPGKAQVLTCLQRYGPTWLLQLPGQLNEDGLDGVRHPIRQAATERMLREFIQATEALSVEQGLILWLEDLHWADPWTLELIDYLARRSQPAQWLLIGSSRSLASLTHDHPLVRLCTELCLLKHCHELALSPLSEAAVAEYLETHFAGLPAALAPLIHGYTNGNPLFLVGVMENLQAQGQIVRHDGQWTVVGAIAALELNLPTPLKALIQHQFSQLTIEEQRLLAAASMIGAAFATAALTAALGLDLETIEEQCAALAKRQHFLHWAGQAEWSNGLPTSFYQFRLACYQQTLYAGLAPNRRWRWRRLIGGEVKPTGGVDQAESVAPSLNP